MAHQDELYLQLLEDCMTNGVFKMDRTGVGSHSVFGRMIRYDLSNKQLPMLTTKKIVEGFIHEMLWFISGDTNIRYLKKHNIPIWDSWLIPGTEEYAELTSNDIKDVLQKHFKVANITYVIGESDQCDGKAFLFIPDLEIADTGILRINRRKFSRSAEDFTPTYAHYAVAYRAVFNKDPRKLVAGDIGPGGYQAAWRHWEDTRIVLDRDWPRYQGLGYEKVVEIPFETEWSGKPKGDQMVITRTIDQLANVIKTLRTDPEDGKDNYNSRRKIVTAWNPGKIEDAALPPCHLYYQFHCEPMDLQEMLNSGGRGKIEGFSQLLRGYMAILDEGVEVPEGYEVGVNGAVYKPGFTEALSELRRANGLPWQKLSCLLLLRSNDLPLGHPFNIAQYGLLTQMVAQCCNMEAGELVWVGADVHIYSNQFEAADEQLSRMPFLTTKPWVELNPDIKEIDQFTFEDITIRGYEEHHPFLKYPPAAV